MKMSNSQQSGICGMVFWTALACAAVAVFSAPAQAVWIEHHGKMLDIAMPGEAVPNQIVVVAETRLAEKGIPALAQRLGAVILRDIKDSGMYLFELSGEGATVSALKEIELRGGPFHAYPNYKMSIPAPPGALERLLEKKGLTLRPRTTEKAKPEPKGEVTNQLYATNDPGVPNQWALWNVKEPFCKSPAAGVKGIAILDTGVDYTHPDLDGKVVSVWDYVGWDNDAMDEEGHGTHCAGIAAAKANNAQGIRGVSPNSKIYAYRVLNASGSGTFFDIMAAVQSAANNTKVHIISMSLGGYLKEGTSAYNDMKKVIDNAVVTKGKIVVVAAGNEANVIQYEEQHGGEKWVPVPAHIPNSFTVGATTEANYRAFFSNYDVSNLKSADGTATYTWNFVDILAPGVNILSTFPGGQYIQASGTSMATPLVAGACARLWDHNPAWNRTQVATQLLNTALSLGAANGFPVADKKLDLYKAIGGPAVTGGFMGQIVHGEAGYPLNAVKVEALAGSTVAATAFSNQGGFYYFTTLKSTTSYILRFSKSGYVSLNVNVGNPAAAGIKDLNMQVIAPSRASTSADENWRIIVYWKSTDPGYYDWYYDYEYWGEDPYYPYKYYNSAGMEANAYLKTPTKGTIYWKSPGSLSASPYVQYMHDSFFSTPMEAHVIRNQEAGTYTYWLTLEPKDICWGNIKYAKGTPNYPMNPVVLVYKGNTLSKVIASSAATRVGSGTKYWHVFNLAGNTVTEVNKIQDTLP
jgi:subtilisin family serine protease